MRDKDDGEKVTRWSSSPAIGFVPRWWGQVAERTVRGPVMVSKDGVENRLFEHGWVRCRRLVVVFCCPKVAIRVNSM